LQILVLAIACTVIAPTFLLVGSEPPSPPSQSFQFFTPHPDTDKRISLPAYSASVRTPSLLSLLRAWFGLSHEPAAQMSRRERFDLLILVILFGTLVGASTAFGILTAQYFQPVGYSSDTAGLFGAALILAGLVAGLVTAPLYDRVFTHHLALTAKVLAPILGAAWLSLIWAVRRDNAGALFAIMAIIGACSLTMLPVGLELGVEITRNAEASSALLWSAGNAVTIMFILGSSLSFLRSHTHGLMRSLNVQRKARSGEAKTRTRR
jgi:FLVCR family MFS transporter 7